MWNLLAIVYPDMVSAMLVTEMNGELKNNYQIELGDERVSVKNKDGMLYLFEIDSLRRSGANPGDLWGYLSAQMQTPPIRLPLSQPKTGTNKGRQSDVGMDDGFIDRLNRVMSMGTSALFILVRRAPVERVIKDLAYYGGIALHTPISFGDTAGFELAMGNPHQKVGSI